jgi:hypothetical protein
MQKASVGGTFLFLLIGFLSGGFGGEDRQGVLRPPSQSRAVGIPIIDAHSQVDQDVELEKVIRLMNQGGVARIILMAKGPIKPKELFSFASTYPGRIIPAVRTKSLFYIENDKRYYQFLKNQVDMRQFGAMSEVLMYHAQKGQRAPLIVVHPDDERVKAALNYARKKKWPFIVHIEFVAAGHLRDVFMTKLETLLDKNSKHPFVLIHMGQLDHPDVRRLIEEHDNISFITSWSNPMPRHPFIVLDESSDPRTKMFDGDDLSMDWKQLMIEHPDRFILGFDNVWPEHWGRYYVDQIKLWREAMKELPLEVAHAFAHGNAERLWHLPPLP